MRFSMLRPRKTVFCCAVLGCIFSSAAAVAAEWSVEPSVSAREEYNDNIRFTNAPHPGVWQTTLSPKVKFSSKTEVSEVSGSAQMNFNRYANEHDLDRNDRMFSVLGSLTSERDVWGMNASYNQDSTSESERLTTGVVQSRTQRSVTGLSPSWSRALTEKSSVRLDYNYQGVKYANPVGLTDYTNQQATGTWQYQWSEQDFNQKSR